jgi:plasmid maintenance system killer protein
MNILPLHSDLVEYLKKRRLVKKVEKQGALLRDNWKHPSLHAELLEPKQMKIFSFRIDKHYRALFIFRGADIIEIIDFNNHYQ